MSAMGQKRNLCSAVKKRSLFDDLVGTGKHGSDLNSRRHSKVDDSRATDKLRTPVASLPPPRLNTGHRILPDELRQMG